MELSKYIVEYLTKKKKPIMTDSNGVTLLELVIVIVIMGIMAFLIMPIISTSTRSYLSINNSVTASIDVISFFAHLDPLFKNNATIIAAGNNQVTFISGTDTYNIFLTNYPGTGPYTVALKKNSDPAYNLISNIADISDPVGPGLEFYYYDQQVSTTNVTANILAVQTRITVDDSPANRSFRTAWSLGDTIKEIP
jgi:prepilin-type N-terminal cleavage/methylation domain-containing protein